MANILNTFFEDYLLIEYKSNQPNTSVSLLSPKKGDKK